MLRFAVVLLTAAMTALPVSVLAQCPPHSPPPSPSPLLAYQEFPAAGPMQTAWYVTFDHGPAKGLYLTSAWFKSGPSKPWVQVVNSAGLAELFVPYASGSPRFLDLSTFNFDLVQATPADAGACGILLGQPAKVVKEVRDKGILWKDDQKVRRGEVMMLWGTLDAANYNYIIQYGFHDDGTIEFRTGATAVNLPSKPEEAHVHNAIWRLDLDLNGSTGDTVQLVRHNEPLGSLSWTDDVLPFDGGTEGSADWVAPEFITLRVTDATLKNARGRATSYDLQPLPRGIARHAESYMRHDFWATSYNAAEAAFTMVETYVANDQPVTNADIVLWYVSPVLHMARSEDGQKVGAVWQGVALAMWGGFDLRPRDLFDTTPFWP
jgi:primary-amine oxidase